MYMYVCMYVYIYIYIYTHIHIYHRRVVTQRGVPSVNPSGFWSGYLPIRLSSSARTRTVPGPCTASASCSRLRREGEGEHRESETGSGGRRSGSDVTRSPLANPATNAPVHAPICLRPVSLLRF